MSAKTWKTTWPAAHHEPTNNTKEWYKNGRSNATINDGHKLSSLFFSIESHTLFDLNTSSRETKYGLFHCTKHCRVSNLHVSTTRRVHNLVRNQRFVTSLNGSGLLGNFKLPRSKRFKKREISYTERWGHDSFINVADLKALRAFCEFWYIPDISYWGSSNILNKCSTM